MINPWLEAYSLALESQKVIGLRLTTLAWGGAAAHTEARQMVAEKVDAAVEATMTLMTGGSVETVLRRYREHVSENTRRLMI